MVNLLSDGLEKFAPSVTRKSRLKKRGQFIYNKEIAEAKQVRTQLERNCNKYRREIDRQLLKAQRNRIRSMAKKHKAHRISLKLENSNPRKLFEQVKSLSAPVVRYLPSGFDNDESLANGFAEYFYDKVNKITADFDDSNNADMDLPSFNGVRFDEFSPLASNEVNKLRKIKCSQLDIIPQLYFVSVWPHMLEVVCKLINSSMASGVFPSIFKGSQITPLIKSPALDPDNLQSYRPVSNLTFVSKVLESTVSIQLINHFNKHKLLDPHQSAYRSGHSVETAFQHVYSSVCHHLDKGKAVFLILIDLSAAFDTVSHSRLVSVLSSKFGISGTVLDWIKSYLAGRSYKVRIGSALSQQVHCDVGVPQGSVLGPILFNCIMSSLPKILNDIGISCHTYADDTQLWVSFDELSDGMDSEASARQLVTQAFRLISSFMKDNHLKLNPNKTQFIPFSRRSHPNSFVPLQLDENVSILPSTEVRNLGVEMDYKLNFKGHVDKIRQSCFFHLKRLRSIRSYIPKEHFITLVHAFVTSRLDFCNSIFYSLPDSLVTRVQTVQNATAKCLTGARKYDSATVARKALHWLPIRYRAKYKILLLAHKIVHDSDSVPVYLCISFSTTKHSRTTRFNLANTLKTEYSARLVTVGGRSIYIAVRDLWNALPSVLRDNPSFQSYKRSLKTHLFKQAYCC